MHISTNTVSYQIQKNCIRKSKKEQMKDNQFSHYSTNSLTRRFQERLAIDFHLKSDTKVVIGVSGGSDSICLLHLFSSSHPLENILAVYVDHNLRPEETPLEKATVSKLCKQLTIHFQSISVDVPEFVKDKKGSIEEGARILRYEALDIAASQFGAEKICVAHNQNDQVEEFFIRLLRGTNSSGLSGMQAVNGKILRPLLEEKKDTLLKHIQQHNLSFCHDSSNDDLNFLRNRIRHKLLPELAEEYNPSIDKTVLQTMSILKEEDHYINTAVTDLFRENIRIDNDQTHLPTVLFLDHHKSIIRRLVDQVLGKLQCKSTFPAIESIIELGKTGTRGKQIHLKDGLRVFKTEDELIFTYPHGRQAHREKVASEIEVDLILTAPGTYLLEPINKTLELSVSNTAPETDQPHLLVLDAALVNFPLQIRNCRPGERFSPFGSNQSKKINRFLTDRKIEANRKSEFPVITSGNTIVCIAGVEIDNSYRVNHNTQEYLIISLTPLNQ